jgi:exosortase/archaeosortase family protein
MNRSVKDTTKQYWIYAISLFILWPFIALLSNTLVNIIKNLGWSKFIEYTLVPVETKFILSVLKILGAPVYKDGDVILLLTTSGWEKIKLTWNCTGWQSLLIQIITLLIGLKSNFTRISKLSAVIIGITGIIFINLVRITLFVMLFWKFGKPTTIFFHNYLADLLSAIWLVIFWWFCFVYLLKDKNKMTT